MRSTTIVVVTFFNHNFVNCKWFINLEIKIYEIKYNISLKMHIYSNNEMDKRTNVSKITEKTQRSHCRLLLRKTGSHSFIPKYDPQKCMLAISPGESGLPPNTRLFCPRVYISNSISLESAALHGRGRDKQPDRQNDMSITLLRPQQ